MKIFINPEHGGSDCGACGNGLIERDVALKIGKRVENYLQAVGYDVMICSLAFTATHSTAGRTVQKLFTTNSYSLG